MSLLIDAYNLLHTNMPEKWAGLDEAKLCHVLGASGWARSKIVVVCDGGFKPGLPIKSPVEEVELRYAGTGHSADAVILQLIEEESAPRRLTVVTNDRAIQKAARRRQANVQNCEQFIHELAREPAMQRAWEKQRDVKPQGKLHPQQVEEWIKRFGFEERK